ncbi:hypothetical protein AS888_17085 [Peribacillus simplex]|uniref:Uncharacterized protein n=1 Tax=Peribacillus simplex TaxID=1478 RepID=A0A109N0L9_9BACI|nr:hypothetical protein AS888_17085 [Peribacillus simplex]
MMKWYRCRAVTLYKGVPLQVLTYNEMCCTLIPSNTHFMFADMLNWLTLYLIGQVSLVREPAFIFIRSSIRFIRNQSNSNLLENGHQLNMEKFFEKIT